MDKNTTIKVVVAVALFAVAALVIAWQQGVFGGGGGPAGAVDSDDIFDNPQYSSPEDAVQRDNEEGTVGTTPDAFKKPGPAPR
jgi:hypothetical protein